MSDTGQCGGYTEIVASDRGPGYAIAQGVSLRVLRGPDEGREVQLEGDRLSIGSAPPNALALTDPAVSRFHCEIVRRPEGVLLRDLESRNGTFVDGMRLKEGYPRPGAVIRVGRSDVVLETGDAIRLRLSGRREFGGLVGQSPAMRRLFDVLERVARTDSTVLILGESGTGKELVARALHDEGSRAKGPFQVVDCGALSPTLIESELFGHQKGAFSGASERRDGAFVAADGGTLFLDEIGELPAALQPKLLRALDAREVRPLGSTKSRRIDVRVVAATNRDLRREVNQKTFRPDLYFRLATITLDLPPLRDRLEDLPALVKLFLAQIAEAHPGAPSVFVTPEQIAAMQLYHWPGNLRELKNHLERAVAFADPVALDADAALTRPFAEAKAAVIDRFEREYLSALIRAEKGNVSAAARRGRMDRAYLFSLLRRHGIDIERK